MLHCRLSSGLRVQLCAPGLGRVKREGIVPVNKYSHTLSVPGTAPYPIHPDSDSPSTLVISPSRVPTALMLAGGVNSADHAQTFPNLVAHLRGQGAYVALLQPHSFGRSVGDALNAVLRQFSGLDTQAEHVEVGEGLCASTWGSVVGGDGGFVVTENIQRASSSIAPTQAVRAEKGAWRVWGLGGVGPVCIAGRHEKGWQVLNAQCTT